MQFSILVLTILIILRNFVTFAWSSDSWKLQKTKPDFSRFDVWYTFVRSRVECILWCHKAYGRGCGYNHKHLCELFLDWGQGSDWTSEEGMDYYVPKSVNPFSNGWVDMRRTGLNSAMLAVKTTMTWSKAKSYCEGLGANLYIMDTAVKRQGLILEFKKQGLTGVYWLGLNDGDREGQWVWGNGAPVETFWMKGEPNNDYNNQNCGSVVTKDTFLMKANVCGIYLKAICELSLRCNLTFID